MGGHAEDEAHGQSIVWDEEGRILAMQVWIFHICVDRGAVLERGQLEVQSSAPRPSLFVR